MPVFHLLLLLEDGAKPVGPQNVNIIKIMKGLGYPRLEYLSAAAFQKVSMPNLEVMTSLVQEVQLVLSGLNPRSGIRVTKE